jgi:2-C-methyl-D-erythritol 4-phosphate cytidylyltransferase
LFFNAIIIKNNYYFYAMQLYAIIVAGGTGTRMQSNLPKQFIKINGKSVIQHTINAFINSQLVFNFIVVSHKNFMPLMQTELNAFTQANIQLIEGGAQRYNSVQNGLACIPTNQNAIILVHDAVRCLVSPELINNLVAQATVNGNAIPVVDVKDSMRLITANNQNKAIERTSLKIVQTPQAFLNTVIQPCFKASFKPEFTDEATVCELAGVKINLVAGQETNIKITYPSDVLFAQNILTI